MAHSARLPALDPDYHRYRNFVEADARFHNAIAVASGNSLLANILAGPNAHAHNYRLCFHSGMADATVNEHRAVQDALIARDPGTAATTMRNHSENARDRLLPIAAPPAGDERADD
jgi:DNA-binding GntR family transcriptional regulator